MSFKGCFLCFLFAEAHHFSLDWRMIIFLTLFFISRLFPKFCVIWLREIPTISKKQHFDVIFYFDLLFDCFSYQIFGHGLFLLGRSSSVGLRSSPQPFIVKHKMRNIERTKNEMTILTYMVSDEWCKHCMKRWQWKATWWTHFVHFSHFPSLRKSRLIQSYCGLYLWQTY